MNFILKFDSTYLLDSKELFHVFNHAELLFSKDIKRVATKKYIFLLGV